MHITAYFRNSHFARKEVKLSVLIQLSIQDQISITSNLVDQMDKNMTSYLCIKIAQDGTLFLTIKIVKLIIDEGWMKMEPGVHKIKVIHSMGFYRI